MLNVVKETSSFLPDLSKGTVTIESSCVGPPFHAAFEELNGMDAVNLAQRFAAANNMTRAFLNGNKSGPYPVNAAGVPLENVRGPNGEALPATHPDMQPARYRLDVPLATPFR